MSRLLTTESTVSSVRSSVSQASSGFAIVTRQEKHRTAIKEIYPPEPPPDYDDFPQHGSPQLGFNTPRRHLSDGNESHPTDTSFESSAPLLLSQSSATQSFQTPPPRYCSDGSVSMSPEVRCESSQPLLVSQQPQISDSRRSIVRISSHDLSIEIVSNSQSPSSDRPFIYTDEQRKPRKKCRPCTKREKILVTVIVIVLVALIFIIVNFTACVGGFTSACE